VRFTQIGRGSFDSNPRGSLIKKHSFEPKKSLKPPRIKISKMSISHFLDVVFFVRSTKSVVRTHENNPQSAEDTD